MENVLDRTQTENKKVTVSVTVPEQVSRFIDEGNPNTHPVAETEKPGTQPSEVPDIGKPDPQTPAPRGKEQKVFGLYPTPEEFSPIGEEESAETIEEELGEVFP